jgi:hypothetical protein
MAKFPGKLWKGFELSTSNRLRLKSRVSRVVSLEAKNLCGDAKNGGLGRSVLTANHSDMGAELNFNVVQRPELFYAELLDLSLSHLTSVPW